MMNCFEARQGFSSFWRRMLDIEQRGLLVAHLRQCARCDRAFRVFALSAPVLHSDSGPRNALAEPDWRDRRLAGGVDTAPSAGFSRVRQWFPICATFAIFAASALAAYLAVTAPVEDLTDGRSESEPVVQLFANEPSLPTDGLAG